ncbi:O-succinylbenzoic acid--CoA ligase [Planobispora rosea]|uniref:O-succinylbenzoic acid--CoA ligase n=1 Tax=Planobispora rosea TaxID=35762 RepID=A0A8J3S8X0_PLARO|nr:AMP-binding protein [Planobispora rosea]GGS71594.1 O-succinylbenzoic acid--CoA ligase [Planobispora rosea]GIH85498.1 O-succinylbenzoic acid--CoA ligase [Planobispora rosea]
MTDTPVVRTVPDLLRLRAAQDPGRTAIEVAGGDALTFEEWERRSDAVAHGLLGLGVRPGDRVGLLFGGGDWTGFAVAYCAAQKAGAVAVPLSDRLAAPEAGYMLDHCSASVVVHAEGLTPPAGPYPAVPAARLENGGEGPTGIRVRSGDLAQILYTSGTTGRPKGVSASHANLVHGCETRPKRRRFRHSEHLLHAFPIGTNAGQSMLMNALDAYPTVVTLARFTPGRFARLIESYRAGTVFVVPAMVIELLNSGLHERHDLSSVVLLGSSAAALPPALSARLAAAFPNATVTNYYTSTEAAPAQTIMIYDPARPAALGRPAFGGALRVADREGRPLPPGETGEIWLRSPAATRSYYGDDRASAETFRDGWVRMGDVGHLDADGYLYLDDRESDVVKTGAFKVSTLQVEAALYEHPQIKEAAVVGVAHQVLGTVLAAAVVPRSPDLSTGELRAFLMDRLARHELPERVLVMDTLPRNQSGKVIKGRLRELLDGPAAQARTEGA